MVFVKHGFTGRLYEAREQGNAWCGFCVMGEDRVCADTVTLSDALTKEKLAASFLMLGQRPVFSDREKEQAFLDAIASLLRQRYAARCILWAADGKELAAGSLCILSADGTLITRDQSFYLETGLELLIKSQSKVAVSFGQDGLTIGTQGYDTASFSGRYAPAGMDSIDLLYFHFGGEDAGTITFDTDISGDILTRRLHAGFQIVTADGSGSACRSQWYPFLADRSEKDHFFCKVCPLLLKGVFDETKARPLIRSSFYYKDAHLTLKSWFLTPEGACVMLVPVAYPAMDDRLAAGFEPVAGSEPVSGMYPFVFSPFGDFLVSSVSEEPWQEIICGLNGVEKVVVHASCNERQKDAMRFVTNQGAFVPKFPLQEADPLGPPVESFTGMTDQTFTTSWVSFAAAMPDRLPCYVAQPERGRLFAFTDSEILLPKEAGVYLPAPPQGACFPMVPYGGVTVTKQAGTLSADEVIQLEQTILFPIRKKQIDQSLLQASQKLRYAQRPQDSKKTDANLMETVATPSGILADIDPLSGEWQRIRLGQSGAKTGILEFGFIKPDDRLQQAFSSGQLCLVAADAAHLGEKCFQNRVQADGWEFLADTGRRNRYGDYASVLILKSCKGSLVELMKNPSKWTMADTFCKAGELTALSQWITGYLKERRTEPLYENFHKKVTDENWNGVLVLKAAVTAVPDSLGGLLAGLDKERFYAHHFMFDFSDIDTAQKKQNGTGTLSGLIDYQDGAYDESCGEKTVAPGPLEYDYKVLRLVCQFECAGLKQFYSLSQISMRTCFGSDVLSMEYDPNHYRALLLRGSYENHGDAPVYNMDIVDESGPGADTFLLDNEILKRVRITKAFMSGSRISMSGFLLFAQIETEAFDLYSYGVGNEGLAFRDLVIEMTYDSKTAGWELSFAADGMQFDQAESAAREKSLVQQFSMTAEGLVCGGERTPAQLGYLPVSLGVKMAALSKSCWYGLRLSMHMGSTGALCANAAVNAECLLAWGTQGGKKCGAFGLKIPGMSKDTQFLSLENVLKLSVGSIRLVKDTKKDAFLLILTNIALKFLGIVNLPPKGSSCLYLFADPKGESPDAGPGWYAAYNREKNNGKKGEAGCAVLRIF